MGTCNYKDWWLPVFTRVACRVVSLLPLDTSSVSGCTCAHRNGVVGRAYLAVLARYRYVLGGSPAGITDFH